MNNLFFETEYLNFEINFRETTVLCIQKWKYHFEQQQVTSYKWPRSMSPSIQDIAFYKEKVKRLIENLWSNRITLYTKSTDQEAILRRGEPFQVYFTIQSVESGQHFTCTVHQDQDLRSYVLFGARQVHLNWDDIAYKRLCTSQSEGMRLQRCFAHYTVAHEFGHTIINPDEYFEVGKKRDQRYLMDKSSMLNLGTQVRNRHFSAGLVTLNQRIKSHGMQFAMLDRQVFA